MKHPIIDMPKEILNLGEGLAQSDQDNIQYTKAATRILQSFLNPFMSKIMLMVELRKNQILFLCNLSNEVYANLT